jgi:hypothetical protein
MCARYAGFTRRNCARERAQVVVLGSRGSPSPARCAGVSSDWGCALGRIAREARGTRWPIDVCDGRVDVTRDRCRDARVRIGRRERRKDAADDAILGMHAGTSRGSIRLDVRSRGVAHRVRFQPPIDHRGDGREDELEDGGKQPRKANASRLNGHGLQSSGRRRIPPEPARFRLGSVTRRALNPLGIRFAKPSIQGSAMSPFVERTGTRSTSVS